MKKYSGETNSYTIRELTEKAQEKAYMEWRNSGGDYFYSGDEIEATVKEFCRLFDVKLTKWSYDEYNYDYDFEIYSSGLNVEEVSGLRLAVYIWNNYAKYIEKGKYYSTAGRYIDGKYHYKYRHSKVMMQMDGCPLTGMCYDCSVLDPIIACLTYKTIYDSYEDLIRDCLDSLFNTACKEYEYCGSREYFIEMAEANEYEFDEDGNDFRLPVGFCVAS